MEPLVKVEGLYVEYRRRGVQIHAVDGVDLSIATGESVGLVGESGCGKSTLARTILRLERPCEGRVWFEGLDVFQLKAQGLRDFRRRAQMVFQDPYGSLNPRMTVGAALDEVLRIHHPHLNRADRFHRIRELLELVGLEQAHAARYPHEFSGGQRQRIGIARALAVEPKFLIADEPVSALDVSVQAQVLNLLRDLRARLRLTYLVIAHDLAVIRCVSERVFVMYLGRIVESGPVDTVYARPAHPYTRALLEAVPDVELSLQKRKRGARRAPLAGDVQLASRAISGCAFHPRCPMARPTCRTQAPALRPVGEARWAACHFAEEVLAQ